MEPRTPLVVFEPGQHVARLAPTAPLGPWALVPLERLLRAAERGRPTLLDLRATPIGAPSQVAAVLWADDLADGLGVDLEVVVSDPVSAELLDFAGVRAPVYTAQERPLAPLRRATAS